MAPNQNLEDNFTFGDEEASITPGVGDLPKEGEPGTLAPSSEETPLPRSGMTSVSDSQIQDSAAFIEATKDIVPLTPAERRLSKKQLLTKRYFDKQRRVPIFIPLEKGELPGTQFYFSTNGYKFYVPKGVRVEVPEEIADRYYLTLGLEQAAVTESKFNLSNASPEKMDRLTR